MSRFLHYRLPNKAASSIISSEKGAFLSSQGLGITTHQTVTFPFQFLGFLFFLSLFIPAYHDPFPTSHFFSFFPFCIEHFTTWQASISNLDDQTLSSG